MGKLGALGPDQQRADEHRVPGEFVVDPRLDPVFRIGAAIEVLRVQRLAFGVGDEIVEQQLEFVGRQTAVLLPPHRFVGRVVDDDELVLGTAAGVHAGFGTERPAMDELAFAIGDGVFDQDRVGRIPMKRSKVFQAEFFNAMRGVPQTRFLHACLRTTPGQRAGND